MRYKTIHTISGEFDVPDGWEFVEVQLGKYGYLAVIREKKSLKPKVSQQTKKEEV